MRRHIVALQLGLVYSLCPVAHLVSRTRYSEALPDRRDSTPCGVDEKDIHRLLQVNPRNEWYQGPPRILVMATVSIVIPS